MSAGRRIGHLILFFLLLAWGSCLAARRVRASSSATVTATARAAVCGNAVKERGEQCDGSDFSGADCASGGFEGGGSLACNPACTYDFSGCLTAADKVEQARFPSDARQSQALTNADGTSFAVAVPAGSSPDDLDAELFSYPDSVLDPQWASPTGRLALKRAYKAAFLDADGASPETLGHPFDLSIRYAESEASGLDEKTLRPFRFGDDHQWHEIAGATVDTTTDTVTFSTAQAGYYRLMGMAPVPVVGDGGIDIGPRRLTAAQVRFSGYAYPNGFVTLLRDGQVVDRQVANRDGFFILTADGLSGGTYVFGVHAEDGYGFFSPTLSFPLSLPARTAYGLNDVDLPPTLAIDPPETPRGLPVRLFGHAQPHARIGILLGADPGSTQRAVVEAAADGAYSYDLETGDLPTGSSIVSARSFFGTMATVPSRTSVLELTAIAPPPSSVPSPSAPRPSPQLSPPPPKPMRGDLDNDGSVDLVDFSIETYWYGKFPVPKKADLDGDGRVTLVDFSIMASHWTG